MYPNPAKDLVNLVNYMEQDYEISILSSNGTLIQQSILKANEQNAFDLSELTNGFYMVRFVNTETGAVQVEKLVVFK